MKINVRDEFELKVLFLIIELRQHEGYRSSTTVVQLKTLTFPILNLKLNIRHAALHSLKLQKVVKRNDYFKLANECNL